MICSNSSTSAMLLICAIGCSAVLPPIILETCSNRLWPVLQRTLFAILTISLVVCSRGLFQNCRWLVIMLTSDANRLRISFQLLDWTVLSTLASNLCTCWRHSKESRSITPCEILSLLTVDCAANSSAARWDGICTLWAMTFKPSGPRISSLDMCVWDQFGIHTDVGTYVIAPPVRAATRESEWRYRLESLSSWTEDSVNGELSTVSPVVARIPE